MIRSFAVAVCLFALVGGAAGIRAEDDRDDALEALVGLLSETEDPAFQLDVLQGLSGALEGRRDVAMPKNWREAYKRLQVSSNPQVRDRALELALIFKDEDAAGRLKGIARDSKADVESRRRSLRLLVEHRAADMQSLLRDLLDDQRLASDALVGLAAFPATETPGWILSRYEKFDVQQRQLALSTLASRRDFALAMLDAAERGTVPRDDISTVLARQLSRLEDDAVNQRLRQVWGEIRQTSEQRRTLINEYKSWLTHDYVSSGNIDQGRLLFEKTCQQCHRMYGQGGQIGPDITGSDRANLDYVLENILDPSAAVPRAYRLSTVVTDEGRVISGLVQPLPNGVLAIQTPTERVLVEQSSVDELRESSLSMMPEGLLNELSREQVRDLVLYLRTKR